MGPSTDIDYDGAISSRYEQGRTLSPEALKTWRRAVRELVTEGMPIVDAGAGTGRFAGPLADLQAGPVIAVEPSTGMRQATPTTTNDRVGWLAATAEALPLQTGSVGTIWSAFTTHYVDLEAAGAEFGRTLAPDGRVLIWHVFPDVFDGLEWFRWFPAARALDEQRMPTAGNVVDAFESAGLRFVGRSEHQMLIASSLSELADRMAHRAISTLTLISDEQFDAGLDAMREAANRLPAEPVYAPNVLLVFQS